ncbi:MAG: gas vesicle protein [Candidatus Eisenbacteria bacterium]|nr:gas vesicle protein [Candidatus Eisenbacteria bacterium]
MEPTRQGRATLADLLDRVLDKGLVLNADVIITLAGVPLIAVSLSAAIAGVETMLEYGLMKDSILSQTLQEKRFADPVPEQVELG